jgi:hypothetical protein
MTSQATPRGHHPGHKEARFWALSRSWVHRLASNVKAEKVQQSRPPANLAVAAPTGDPPITETESEMADTPPMAPAGGKLGGGATQRHQFQG